MKTTFKRIPSSFYLSSLLATMTLLATAHGQTVLRTNVYHQLTQFTNYQVAPTPHNPILSANGSKIAFSCYSYSGTGSNVIYSVNFDGSGLNLLDQWQNNNSASVDITADGSKIISWVGGYLRMVNSDGNNAHAVALLTDAHFDFRLSPAGNKIYFAADANFNTVPPGYVYPPGLYSMNMDGTGLTNILNAATVASHFALDPSSVYMGAYDANTKLAVSGDGQHLLFQVYANGYRLLGINADGSGLKDYPLAGTVPDIYSFQVYNCGLSPDGSRLFYYTYRSGTQEVGAFDWDGSNHQVLFTASGSWNNNWPQMMNQNGSSVLFSDGNLLIGTNGSAQQLGVPNGGQILSWGLYHSTMDAQARRFAFLKGGSQIATMEINPTNTGAAPVMSQCTATPAWALVNSGSMSSFSAKATPTNGLYNGIIDVGILFNGNADGGSTLGGTGSLYDNGSGGDAQAGDSIYTYAWLYPECRILGPHTLRYKAEVMGSNSLYHATIIETGPFFILASPPAGPAPAITTVSPANAGAGTTVTITGSGFDPNASNNFILFGNTVAQVVSVNPAGTQIVVIVPPDLPIGPLQVTVSSLGQTSSESGFTVPDPYASSLSLMMLAGVNLVGTVGMTYRVDYLTDLDNTNSWTPLVTNTLTSSPWFWPDVTSTNQARRFYRSVRIQQP